MGLGRKNPRNRGIGTGRPGEEAARAQPTAGRVTLPAADGVYGLGPGGTVRGCVGLCPPHPPGVFGAGNPFRCPEAGDHWSDDDHAHGHDGVNSRIGT